MNELRWILLVAGALLIAGIYAWGVRARRRAATPGHERSARVEPARTVPIVTEPVRTEPEVGIDDAEPGEFEAGAGDAFEDLEDEPAIARRVPGAVRREPRLDPRVEPRLEPRVEPRPEPRLEPEPSVVEPAAEPAPGPEASPAAGTRRAPPQKIVAVRVVAAPGAHFEGSQLLASLEADGFTFGRYQIFHRLDATGRPLVSLASLKEPGTFDPPTMPGSQFRGVALFAVMPGPLPGLRSFDELIVTARALAATLGGHLQDERGGPLSVQRIGHLREEVAEFERARAADGG